MKIKLYIVFLHLHQELNHQQHVGFRINFIYYMSFLLAVYLSPPSSSSSSSLSTTTNLQIDCNIKTETTNNTAAITRAFDNLAKAAAHVRKVFL